MLKTTRPIAWTRALKLALITGALLRWGTALVSSGFDHPNENYRLLEPIASLWGYSARLPWEWTQGLLSTLPVHLHLELLNLASALGIHGALAQATLLRLIYATLSLLPILASWRLVLWSGGSVRLASTAAWMMALWPEAIFRSARLMDYTLEAALLAGALLLLVRKRELFAGLVLGLAFFVRFQSGLYFIAALVAIALTPRPKKLQAVTTLTLGYGVAVFGLAGLETHWGSGFLSPFWHYLDFNLMQGGAARAYGADPWHRYFSESAKFLGFTPFVLLLGLTLTPPADRRLLVFFAFPFVAHTLVSHKEGRFILGFLWLLIPAGLSGLKSIKLNRSALIMGVFFLSSGFIIQLFQVVPKLRVRAEEPKEFSRLASMIDPEIPVEIDGDPDFLPGAFFFRHRGPVCYDFAGNFQGQCPLPSGAKLRLKSGTQCWEVVKEQAKTE
jgi:hypothetical protein